MGFNPVSRELMYVFLVENAEQPRRWPQRSSFLDLMRDLLADFGGLAAEARDHIVDPERVLQGSPGRRRERQPPLRGGVAAVEARPCAARGRRPGAA